jgi:hypothetical protein
MTELVVTADRDGSFASDGSFRATFNLVSVAASDDWEDGRLVAFLGRIASFLGWEVVRDLEDAVLVPRRSRPGS